MIEQASFFGESWKWYLNEDCFFTTSFRPSRLGKCGFTQTPEKPHPLIQSRLSVLWGKTASHGAIVWMPNSHHVEKPRENQVAGHLKSCGDWVQFWARYFLPVDRNLDDSIFQSVSRRDKTTMNLGSFGCGLRFPLETFGSLWAEIRRPGSYWDASTINSISKAHLRMCNDGNTRRAESREKSLNPHCVSWNGAWRS